MENETNPIEDIISQIENGKFSVAADGINNELYSRAQNVIDQTRIRVAGQMFNDSEEFDDEDDEEDFYDDIDYDEEDEDLDEEDYS